MIEKLVDQAWIMDEKNSNCLTFNKDWDHFQDSVHWDINKYCQKGVDINCADGAVISSVENGTSTVILFNDRTKSLRWAK